MKKLKKTALNKSRVKKEHGAIEAEFTSLREMQLASKKERINSMVNKMKFSKSASKIRHEDKRLG